MAQELKQVGKDLNTPIDWRFAVLEWHEYFARALARLAIIKLR